MEDSRTQMARVYQSVIQEVDKTIANGEKFNLEFTKLLSRYDDKNAALQIMLKEVSNRDLETKRMIISTIDRYSLLLEISQRDKFRYFVNGMLVMGSISTLCLIVAIMLH